MVRKKAGIVLITAIVIMSSLTACQMAEDEIDNGISLAEEIKEEVEEETEDETKVPDAKQDTLQSENKAQTETGSGDKQAAEQSSPDTMNEPAASGEDLDVVVPDAADDNWYMNGNIYTDDKGNRLEVYFDDHGMIEFAVNGLSMYYTTVENFQQENNWKVYTCDNGLLVIYYPGEPAHLEISDGDYAGLYEAGGDKIR